MTGGDSRLELSIGKGFFAHLSGPMQMSDEVQEGIERDCRPDNQSQADSTFAKSQNTTTNPGKVWRTTR